MYSVHNPQAICQFLNWTYWKPASNANIKKRTPTKRWFSSHGKTNCKKIYPYDGKKMLFMRIEKPFFKVQLIAMWIETKIKRNDSQNGLENRGECFACACARSSERANEPTLSIQVNNISMLKGNVLLSNSWNGHLSKTTTIYSQRN